MFKNKKQEEILNEILKEISQLRSEVSRLKKWNEDLVRNLQQSPLSLHYLRTLLQRVETKNKTASEIIMGVLEWEHFKFLMSKNLRKDFTDLEYCGVPISIYGNVQGVYVRYSE